MKKLLAGILSIALLISLCACSGAGNTESAGNKVPGGSVPETKSEGGNGSGADNHTDVPTETPTEESTEVPTEAGADLSDVLLNISIEYYRNDKLSSSESYDLEYDAKGNRTCDVSVGEETKGTVIYISKTQYTYDDTGRVIYSSSMKDGSITYNYDDAGRLISIDIDPTTQPVQFTYDYDDAGNLIREWSDGATDADWDDTENLYTYENSRLVRIEYISGSASETDDYFYDEAGRLALIRHTGRYDSISIIQYYYNDAGDLILVEYKDELKGEYNVYRSDDYTYDAQGRVLNRKSYLVHTNSKYIVTYTYGDY